MSQFGCFVKEVVVPLTGALALKGSSFRPPVGQQRNERNEEENSLDAASEPIDYEALPLEMEENLIMTQEKVGRMVARLKSSAFTWNVPF